MDDCEIVFKKICFSEIYLTSVFEKLFFFLFFCFFILRGEDDLVY